MKPYPDQEIFVTELGRALTRKRKIVGQLPTGGGKTVVFSAISSRYIKKSGKRVLILVHRKELLTQTRKTAYNAFKLECQPIIAGMKYIPPADIYVGMVESVFRRIDKIEGIGLVIIDEAHRLEFIKLHAHFPEQYIIGFTATPLTSSKKKPLNLYYDDIVCGPDIPALIQTKRLCQNITWAPKDVVDRLQLELDNKGEFADAHMAAQFSKAKYINNTVTAYAKWSKGLKAIIFNVNIDHSKVVAEAFIAAGYPCRHLDSEMSATTRTETLAWFTDTPGAILCNVGIATTGFDEPTIETVIVNKATTSMPLWLQMCGRGSRVIKNRKSAFTIIDMGGNAITHGDWSQSRNWIDLFHNPPKVGKSQPAPVKSCPECDAIIPAGVKICPYCGFQYAEKIATEIELNDFVVVTKGIDVDKITAENAHKKLFYPFFKIGTTLAIEAKNTIPVMSDEYATFIIQIYFDLAKVWANKKGKRFNKWMRITATKHIVGELQNRFEEWETKLMPHLHDAEPFENITNLKPINALHN